MLPKNVVSDPQHVLAAEYKVLAAATELRWELPPDQIDPIGDERDRRYDDSALEALASSMLQWGQLQPVIVRRTGNRYEIVCGERRWRAIKRAGIPKVWVVEHSASELEALAIRLADNLHHVSLSQAERIAALDQFAELVGSGGLRETARRLGMDPSWLSRQLAIRKDPVIFAALERGQIGFGQAAELRRAPHEQIPVLLERVLASDVNVPTATIRRWVEGFRGPMRRTRRSPNAREHVTATEALPRPVQDLSFAAVLGQLRTLGAPASAEERTALEQLVETARRLLGATPVTASPRPAPPAHGKTSHTELSCLLCGELAGLRYESGAFEITSRAGVKRHRGVIHCGRCGGALTTGAFEVQYKY